MNPAVIAALTPIAIELGSKIIDGILLATKAPPPNPERVANAKKLEGDLIGLEARIAGDPNGLALLTTLLSNKRAELRLALDAMRLDVENRSREQGDAFVDGLATGAYGAAVAGGRMALEEAKRRAGA